MIPEKLMSIREGLIYMNHASIGPMPTRALVEHVQGYGQLAAKGEAGLDFDGMITKWDEVRTQFASLINGKTEGVAITTNTASGLHLVADGLSHLFKPGANIVINEMEFTTNSYLWQKVCKRYGMELRVAPFANHFSQLEALIDHQTVLVSISFVQFSNGYTADMEWISRLCKENDALFVVDAIQGLGAVPFDVERMGVDFVASGGYKWLLGPLGSGYFYANPQLDDIFDSVLVGWFGDRDFSRMTHHGFEPWPDARQYQPY
ncbi:MAG: aminotransferase class V-fold PLP-dependent enzyme, partial [Candidatus Kariarchaeaceae archaeon]